MTFARLTTLSRAGRPRSVTLIVWLMVLAAAAAAGARAGSYPEGLAMVPGDAAPEIIAWNLDAELEAVPWQGRVTLVNFWSTWCQPCRAEMPELQKIHDDYADQAFRVVGLTKEGATLEQAKSFLDEVGVSYPIYQLYPRFDWRGVNVLPTSFLLDREGKLLRKYVATWDGQIEDMRRDITDALAGRPLQPMSPRPAEGASSVDSTDGK